MGEGVKMPEDFLAEVIAQFADLAEALADFREQVEQRLRALEARSPCPMIVADGES
jgi:hypothetical protein